MLCTYYFTIHVLTEISWVGYLKIETLFFQVIEFYRRLMLNADYDVIEQPPNNDDLLDSLMTSEEFDYEDAFNDTSVMSHDEN